MATLTRLRLIAAAALFALAVPTVASAQSMHDKEAQMKVAFLYRFAMFVDWPMNTFQSDDSPLVIAVIGRDPFDGQLERLLDGKRVGGRPLSLVMLGRPNRARLAATPFHVLFLSRSEDDHVGEWLNVVKGRPVLTVSDTPSFSRNGGTIELVSSGDRLEFAISRTAAEANNLRLSSRLLALAHLTDH